MEKDFIKQLVNYTANPLCIRDYGIIDVNSYLHIQEAYLQERNFIIKAI